MKNEKFCFNKGVGVIALIGIVLVGLVLVSQTLTNTQTSTSSRASQNKQQALNTCVYENLTACIKDNCSQRNGTCKQTGCSKPTFQCEKKQTECQKVGKFDVADGDFKTAYYTRFCEKNEDKPLWNGSNASPKCYTATLVCGNVDKCNRSECIADVNEDTQCLYKEVNFAICEQARIGSTPNINKE